MDRDALTKETVREGTLTQRVASFVASLEFAEIPEPVVEKARVTLLHDLGVGLAGHELVGVAFSLAKDLGRCSRVRGARLPVDGTPVTVEMAALATGALIHGRTQDDTQPRIQTHLGCTTLPAILALGDRDDATGREFLTAMVAGYEAGSAIADGYATLATERGFRATTIYGPLAAAAACSRLIGLSADETASALGIASSFGGGTNQTWVAGTQEWQYQVGAASRTGMIAALLAQRGVTGAPDALEGSAGHYLAFAGASGDGDAAIRALGHDWQILQVMYKPYPICAINQGPVAIMIDLVERHRLREREIEEVIVTLSPRDAAYPGVDTHGPFTDVGASLMSAPFCLAVAIRNGGIRVTDLRNFEDVALSALVGRIHVARDANLPGHASRVTVRTSGESTFTAEGTLNADMFRWGRDRAIKQLRALADEMPLSPQRLESFMAVSLDLENRGVRDLISSTLRPKRRTRLN